MAYRTLHHTPPKIRKVTLPGPPALPSFDLTADDDLDETEIAATAQRHAVRPVDDRIVPRRSPDSTSEVALEDILLEAYETPPLTVQRPSRPMLPPPPTRQQLADLDDLLKLSVRPVPRYHPDQETPSVAPVALSNPSFVSFPSVQGYASELLGPTYGTDSPPAAPKRSAMFGLLAAAALLVMGGVVGLAIVVVPGRLMPKLPSLSTLRAKPHTLASAAPRAHVMIATAPPAPAPTPEVNVSSLPKQEIASNMTLVTFPPRSVGHRNWVDGVVVSSGVAPMTVKCGRHNVKLGGKTGRVNLPCGEAYEIK